MKKVSVIAAAVAATLAAGSAFAVDFNGYFRAGTAISSNGTGDAAFMKNGVGRLGNENDNYYEIGLAEDLKTGDQTWRLESMIAQGADGANGWEEKGVNIAQFAVKAKGLIASDKEATMWAGKTYYQRKDIHITDFYFLNTSGTGGGIENLSVGNQKLSLAIIENASGTSADDGSGYIFDARLANIGLWDNATLELAMAYNFATEKDGKDIKGDDGVLATAIIHQGLSNGFNQTVLQYGTAGYGQQVSDYGNGGWIDRSGLQNDATGYRLINWGVMNLGESWEMGHQLVYQAGSDIGYVGGQGDSDQYSAVVRPMYKWNDTMRTVFEAGIAGGEKPDGTDFGGHKLTVAQAWAMGDSFWSRPELRVYGSYITDEEGTTFGDKKGDSDFLVGVQVEAWW